MIDVTMTGCLRSDLHKQVFESLRDNLRTKETLGLVLNIDPIGLNEFPETILNQAKKYFNDIYCNVSQKPSFLSAVKTVFNNSQGDYILNWEDDWILQKPLDLDVCEELLFLKDNISLVGLDIDHPKHNKRREKQLIEKYSSFYFYYSFSRLHFPPALLKRTYVNGILNVLSNFEDVKRPGNIFRNTDIGKRFIQDWKIINYLGRDKEGRLVKDLGRNWKRKHNIQIK